MNMISRALLIFSIWISVLSAATFAQEEVRLTNGYWPPFHGEHSPHYGLASHIVSRAFELEGYKVVYEFFPWKRAMMIAQSEGWDGTFTWVKTDERAKNFVFSDSVFKLPDHILTLKENDIQFDGVSSIRDLRIGFTNGYDYGDEFRQLLSDSDARIQVNNTDVDNIKKLLEKHIDAFPITKAVGLFIVRNRFTKDQEKFKMSEKPFRDVAYRVLFSKTSKGHKEYVKRFNSGLKQLKQSGEYARMLEASMRGEYDPKTP